MNDERLTIKGCVEGVDRLLPHYPREVIHRWYDALGGRWVALGSVLPESSHGERVRLAKRLRPFLGVQVNGYRVVRRIRNNKRLYRVEYQP